jgi:hypothetical protein
MITLHVTADMISAGTRALYGHAKAEPERTVVAVFVAMMQACGEMSEIGVQVEAEVQADEPRPRH